MKWNLGWSCISLWYRSSLETGIQTAWHSSISASKPKENSIIILSPIEQYCLDLSELKREPDPAEGNIDTNGLIKSI
jgi:hypothetical protein